MLHIIIIYFSVFETETRGRVPKQEKKIVEISTFSLIPLHPSTQCGTSTSNPFWCAADIFNAHKQLGSS